MIGIGWSVEGTGARLRWVLNEEKVRWLNEFVRKHSETLNNCYPKLPSDSVLGWMAGGLGGRLGSLQIRHTVYGYEGYIFGTNWQ